MRDREGVAWVLLFFLLGQDQRGIKVDDDALFCQEGNFRYQGAVGVDPHQQGTAVQGLQRFQHRIVVHIDGVQNGQPRQGIQLGDQVVGDVDVHQLAGVLEGGQLGDLVVSQFQLLKLLWK